MPDKPGISALPLIKGLEMGREAAIRRYLDAMARSDLEAVMACFNPAAIVISPVYGAGPARPFYERLFADTALVRIAIRTIYSDAPGERWAAHFDYGWHRRNGQATRTELVDLFEFSEGSDTIAKLQIVFDTGAPKPARN